MSVVSENSSRRPSQRSTRTARSLPRGRVSSSDVTAPFLVPHFSAAASEGVKASCDEDNWAENTTVITGNTSERSYSGAADRAFVVPVGRVVARRCSRLLWLSSALFISLLSIGSSPAMVLLPFLLRHTAFEWPEVVCLADCQGLLLNMTMKTLLLVAALWAMYFRRAAADMPRLFVQRVALIFCVLFILFAFWLFYAVRVIFERQSDYRVVVTYALSLLDALLYFHYISVIILELRTLRPEYIVSVVRDPDGESRTFTVGQMSIQQAAVHILRTYTATFPSYNPHLDKLGGSLSRFRSGVSQASAGFKMYDIEGLGAECTISEANARALMEAAAKRRVGGHNGRFHEMMEWERRIQKRKCRLISTTEDAFAGVQSVAATSPQNQTLSEPMEAVGAAQAVFAVIARPLNKYLKLTRQQPRHSADQVVAHLARCLSLRFSAATFLQRFFSPKFPLPDRVEEAKWSIISNKQASEALHHGTVFVLRCHQKDDDAGVQLLCSFHSLPFFNLTEQQSSASKFALKITPESAV
ncbi:Vang-like protein 1 [Toxocara canis]|uniref:Vang-like protein n=1 Tax=Toxocara canis TaxID=6265 RepID=A0A0B2W3B7_TOXCA|nr:Vang-like protein 1 [Toxocara canis]